MLFSNRFGSSSIMSLRASTNNISRQWRVRALPARHAAENTKESRSRLQQTIVLWRGCRSHWMLLCSAILHVHPILLQYEILKHLTWAATARWICHHMGIQSLGKGSLLEPMGTIWDHWALQGLIRVSRLL